MLDKEKNYFYLILFHIILGIIVFYAPIISKIYSYSILLIGIIALIKTQNKNNEVLYICGYIIGSEVFLRMTNGNPNHEFAKYSIIFFMFLGYLYSGFSKNIIPYLLFIIVLIPGILIANESLDFGVEFRKKIAFNLSGSLCLAIAAIYTFGRKVSINQIGTIMLLVGLPIISTAVYANIYAPSLKEALTGTSSNEMLSGGFGPNQVATIFGLGMFVFFTRIILYSRTKIIFTINILLAFYISYRGLLTFSRGGILTGFIMIFIFIFFMYINSNFKGKRKLNYFLVLFTILTALIWGYTSFKTDGLIDKRYSNKDALGRVKKDEFSGRSEIAEQEINWFLENPFFGIGVGKGTDYRTEEYGFVFASHDEITRLLAEHGSFGILALIILISTPLFHYLGNKQNIYLFCFLFFWLLTINHAAMRTASPSFIYSLALLNVYFEDE